MSPAPGAPGRGNTGSPIAERATGARTSHWQHADPFFGTDEPGGGLMGPYLPHGLVRLGPDSAVPHFTAGHGPGPLIHFSHTHVAGTGGGGRYGNVAVVPYAGPTRLSGLRHDRVDEVAEPGYYRVTLRPEGSPTGAAGSASSGSCSPDRCGAPGSGIVVELTVTERVGLHRYRYQVPGSHQVFLDLGAAIHVRGEVPGAGTGGSIGGWLQTGSPREIWGRGDYRGGWGHGQTYSVFFYLRFDTDAESIVAGNFNGPGPLSCVDGPACRASADFGARETVEVRVGISMVSVAQARSQVEATMDRSFDQIRMAARDSWEQEFARLHIENAPAERQGIFYSSVLRLRCLPTDLGVDSENHLWHSGVRQFTDYYTLWDSVRNANSLFALVDPDFHRDMLNSLLDIADHVGWMPDSWIAGHFGKVQGGCSAAILFCEAALKGIEGVDYRKALAYLRRDAEHPSDDPEHRGRHLADYRDLGYVSTRVRSACVSRHIEYSYQDWCIGRLAGHLGETATAHAYYASSTKLWNLWDPALRSFAPRSPDGDWLKPFDPESSWPDWWNDPYFYEGGGIQWSFSAHQDFADLVRRHGGPAGFVRHLDHFFGDDLPAGHRFKLPYLDNGVGFYYSKETMLHVPWLYHYAGRPDLTARRVRQVMDSQFRTGRGGLSDNEDMGCQSAWFIFATLGLYPVMGQDIYLLATPRCGRSVIALGNGGRTLTIEVKDFSEGKPYITRVSLNGQDHPRNWLRHAEIAPGGVLEIETAAHPGDWGREAPPSAMA